MWYPLTPFGSLHADLCHGTDGLSPILTPWDFVQWSRSTPTHHVPTLHPSSDERRTSMVRRDTAYPAAWQPLAPRYQHLAATGVGSVRLGGVRYARAAFTWVTRGSAEEDEPNARQEASTYFEKPSEIYHPSVHGRSPVLSRRAKAPASSYVRRDGSRRWRENKGVSDTARTDGKCAVRCPPNDALRHTQLR